MSEETENTTFLATVAKVQTLTDGGLRFTFDVGESEIEAFAVLATYKRFEKVLLVTVEEWQGQDENGQGQDEKRRNKPKY